MQETCCHLVSEHEASAWRLCSSVRQFLIYSTVVLVASQRYSHAQIHFKNDVQTLEPLWSMACIGLIPVTADTRIPLGSTIRPTIECGDLSLP